MSLTESQATTAACSPERELEVLDSLKLPRVLVIKVGEPPIPSEMLLCQDRTGSLPSAPPKAQPAAPLPDPKVAGPVAVIRAGFYAEVAKLEAELNGKLYPVIGDIALGKPGAYAARVNEFTTTRAAFETAAADIGLPELKNLGVASEEILAVLRANKGKPETDKAILDGFRGKLLRAMGKKDFKDIGEFQIPETGWTEETVTKLVLELKHQTVQNALDERTFLAAVGAGNVGSRGGALEWSQGLDPKLKEMAARHIKRAVGEKPEDAAALRDAAYEKYGTAFDLDAVDKALPSGKLVVALQAWGPLVSAAHNVVEANALAVRAWQPTVTAASNPNLQDPQLEIIRATLKGAATPFVVLLNKTNKELVTLGAPPITMEELRSKFGAPPR